MKIDLQTDLFRFHSMDHEEYHHCQKSKVEVRLKDTMTLVNPDPSQNSNHWDRLEPRHLKDHLQNRFPFPEGMEVDKIFSKKTIHKM